MTTRDVFGLWDCTSCYARGIYGPERRCPSCGNPREVNELARIYLPPRDATGRVIGTSYDVRPEHRAGGDVVEGPDRDCPYCDSGNSAARTNCGSCGALLPGVRFQPRPPLPPVPAKQGKVEAATVRSVPEVAAPKPTVSRPPPAPPGPRAASEPARRWLRLVVAGILILFPGSLLAWGFSTTEVPGEVISMAWEHTTWRERFTPAEDEAWCSTLQERPAVMPNNGAGEDPGARVISQRSKHHHYRQVPDGMKSVQKTRTVQKGTRRSCSHSNNGNGTFRETCRDVPVYGTEHYTVLEQQYRDVSVEAPWCRFETWRWRPDPGNGGRITADGAGVEGMHWPTVELGLLDRSRRAGKWSVIVRYRWRGKDHAHDLRPEDETSYRQWAPGMTGTVRARNFGGLGKVLREDFGTLEGRHSD